MKRYLNLLMALVFITAPFASEAQLLNKIRRAAEQGVSNAVERRVEKEMEKATQRQLEKAFGELYGPSDEDPTGGYDFSKIMKGINMNVLTEDSYSFSGVAIMEITGTDEDGKATDPVIMKTLLNEASEYSGMEISAAEKKEKSDVEKTIMIFDMKNNASIILVENEDGKASMAYGLDFDAIGESAIENDANEPNDSVEEFEFKKTGNSKTIAGYTCDEYTTETEEHTGSFWVARESVGGIGSFWGKNEAYFNKKLKDTDNQFSKLPQGDILEITSQSKEDKSSFKMTMTDLDHAVPNKFVMADYPNVMAGATAEK